VPRRRQRRSDGTRTPAVPLTPGLGTRALAVFSCDGPSGFAATRTSGSGRTGSGSGGAGGCGGAGGTGGSGGGVQVNVVSNESCAVALSGSVTACALAVLVEMKSLHVPSGATLGVVLRQVKTQTSPGSNVSGDGSASSAASS